MTSAARALTVSGLLVLLPWSAAARADAAGDRAAAHALVKAQAGVLRTFRSAMTTSTNSLLASLAALDKTVAQGTAGTGAPASLFDSLTAFQTAVQANLKTAVDGQASAAKDILAGAGITIEGLYPPALYPGDGTPTASFEAAVDGLVARTYSSARKRIARTAAGIEKAGTHLDFRLLPPLRRARIWDSTRFDFLISSPPTVDVVVASNPAASTTNGSIRVGGEAVIVAAFPNDVTVSAIFRGTGPSQTVTPADGRYATDFGGAPVVVGVYLIAIIQGTVAGSETTVGVR
jgi:hypothetical protein